MKKELFVLLILVLFLSACTSGNQRQEQYQEPEIITTESNNGLGDLCSSENECASFCENNRGRCETYCRGNYENQLCLVIFPPEPGEEVNRNVDAVECVGDSIKFDYSPVNLNKTLVFLPLGLMTGSHVTPIDHHYFQNFDNQGFDIEVYSPGDGAITSIQHMPGAKEGEDYRIVIQHTCTVDSVYIHLGKFADKFKDYVPVNGHAGVRIPVKAGELIGYYERNIDYNLVDEEVILEGFVVPESYVGESWKIHVPNTYNYFNEPVKSQLIQKSVRTVEPLSGKIDYDIDGKLIGNWFLEGTNGYAGVGTQREKYWAGHLSIVYDAYDPERIVFSIAGYGGEDSRQFAVKGNTPNPSEVGIEDGLIKYELVQYDWITPAGNSWDRKSLAKNLSTRPNNNVEGVVLVQMLEPRKIKFETFPGKTASQVNGFTSNAKIYER